MRGRSTSEVIFRNIRRSSSWNEPLPILRPKLSVSLQNSNQNLLTLPKIDVFQRRSSTYSDGDISENPFFTSDIESGEEGENDDAKYKLTVPNFNRLAVKRSTLPALGKKHKPLPPIVAVIPPDEEILFLTR